MTDTDTYAITLLCRNCRKDHGVNIPKGQTIVFFILDRDCPTCGCRALQISPYQAKKGY